jgi:hypothetical protein
MSGLLRTIEIEALETLHADRGDVDRIGEIHFLIPPRFTKIPAFGRQEGTKGITPHPSPLPGGEREEMRGTFHKIIFETQYTSVVLQ